MEDGHPTTPPSLVLKKVFEPGFHMIDAIATDCYLLGSLSMDFHMFANDRWNC